MENLRIIAQLIIALGILNVWLFHFNIATPYRAGNAGNMKEEFATYGLPMWFMWLIGGLKVLLALLLLAGLWIPLLITPAAIVMAVLMFGAILMHIKVRDKLKKLAPASAVFVLSLMVAII